VGKWDAKPEPERPEQGADDSGLRETKRVDGKVEIRRELGGDGHLARGDRTRFHTLNFSAKAIPRTERDPAFSVRDDPIELPEASPPPAPPIAPAAPVEAEPDNVIDRLKRWLGGS
jgi:hypothetical protein